MGFMSTFDNQINQLTIFQFMRTYRPFLENWLGFTEVFFRNSSLN